MSQKIYSGPGSPEGIVVADAGAIYVDCAKAGFSVLYQKESGSAASGWVKLGSTLPASAPIAITGAKLGSDVVMANLLAALVSLGLVTDSTT